MFTFTQIGFVQSPFKETSQIPRGLGAKHETEGVLEILREFEPGLMDIEGFSHLYVLWAFDRSQAFELIAHPPTDENTRMECSPRGLRAGQIPSRSPWLNCSAATEPRCACAAWTCWMERRFSTSSPTCRASRQIN